MSTLRCPTHGVPIHNASLCPTCLADLERDLGDIPALVDELDTTLARQDHIERGGFTELDPDAAMPVTARIQPLAYNPIASTVGTELHATLVGWVRDIHGEMPIPWPADNATAMSRWLLRHFASIRTHPAADQLRDEIGYAVDQVRRAVDRPTQRMFVGPCLNPVEDVGKCQADLYARPSAATVICHDCGAEHDIGERRTWLLAQAEDQLAHAELIGRAAPALGVEVTPAAIRGYAIRGRIVPHGTDLQGRPLYRVGDVIDVARDVLARRSEKKERERRAG